MGLAKILGNFGVYPPIPPFFGAEDGDGAFEDFGCATGTGNSQILGILWGKIPKNLQISGQGWGKESRGFSHHYSTPFTDEDCFGCMIPLKIGPYFYDDLCSLNI